jgi:hypothetical protein
MSRRVDGLGELETVLCAYREMKTFPYGDAGALIYP